MYGIGKVKKAEEYLKNAEIAFMKFNFDKNDTLYSNYLNRKGYYYIIRSELENAKVAYHESTKFGKKRKLLISHSHMLIITLAIFIMLKATLSNAKLYFSKSLKIRERIFAANDLRLARTYSTYGAFLITLAQLKKLRNI